MFKKRFLGGVTTAPVWGGQYSEKRLVEAIK